MKRELAALALVGGLLVAGWVGYGALFGTTGGDALLVVDVEGTVRHHAGGRDDLARSGDYVKAGERLTSGSDGTAVLSFGAETRVTLRPDSSVQVVGVGAEGVRLDLDGGRVQATVREGGAPVQVKAGDRSVTARDADVTVGRDAEGTVAVEPSRGRVTLEGFGVPEVASGERVVAPVGEAAAVVVARQALLLDLAAALPPRTRDTSLELGGATEPGAVVRVTGGSTPVSVRARGDGAFRVTVPLVEGRNSLLVTAVNALGQEATVQWGVERDTTAPGIQVEIR